MIDNEALTVLKTVAISRAPSGETIMDADIDKRFSERAESFADLWHKHVDGWPAAFGLRIMLLPCEAIRADVNHLCPPAVAFTLKAPQDLDPCMSGDIPRCVIEQAVRGVNILDANGHYHRRLICEDGLIEYLTIDPLPKVHPGPSLAVVGNALLAVDQLRRASDKPEVDFILTVEIRTQGNVSIIDYDLTHKCRPLGTIPAHKILPQHRVTQKEDFGCVWTAVEKDVWIACRAQPKTPIDFDRIIKSLN